MDFPRIPLDEAGSLMGCLVWPGERTGSRQGLSKPSDWRSENGALLQRRYPLFSLGRDQPHRFGGLGGVRQTTSCRALTALLRCPSRAPLQLCAGQGRGIIISGNWTKGIGGWRRQRGAQKQRVMPFAVLSFRSVKRGAIGYRACCFGLPQLCRCANGAAWARCT